MNTATTLKLLRVKLGNLHHSANSPSCHPGDPQPRRVDLGDDVRDCHKGKHTQKRQEESNALTRNHISRVDVHLLVIDAVLVTVSSVEVHAPEEDQKADGDAMLDDVNDRLLIAGDRSPTSDCRVTNGQTENVLGVHEDFAEDGSLQVGVDHDTGRQGQHQAPAEREMGQYIVDAGYQGSLALMRRLTCYDHPKLDRAS